MSLASAISPATRRATAARAHRIGQHGRGVIRYVLIRLGLCLLVVMTSFALIRLIPGDPARRLLGPQADATAVAATHHQLGLDDSLPHQFGRFVSGIARGDLGTSFRTGAPVVAVIGDRLPGTLQLAGLSFLVIYVVGIAVGVVAAAFTSGGRRRWLDQAFALMAGLAGAVPEYVQATLLVAVFAVGLKLLPVAGASGPTALVLPMLAISIPSGAYVARLVRTETLEVLTSDYVRTARSKRLPVVRLFGLHVVPGAVAGAGALAGLLFSNLVGGTVVIETVFARPGLGSALVQAINDEDYPVIQGIVLTLGLVVVVASALMDAVLVCLDPRRRA